ncbi:MAG: permease, partial [Sphingobacteriaceae bacterium]|nr:permease [Cytophagaceae bacterium]
KALFDKKDTPYEVDFTARILDKANPMIDRSKIAAKVAGTLADFKKVN